ncbi:hypothetical protein CYMTET_53351 [Cymbomonas tetramitiformis]|uniref:Uncharacterized protein n=1 Tax=Cymbomonas tetramitiformis TaxID=36881 RepID=A0AAE0BH31_9CHLO|nr:hypothetical protein CYMTET_53351 [Cymbomonas tetramitiformis]
MKYTQMVRDPVLAYLHDAVQYSEGTMDLLEQQATSFLAVETIEQRVFATHNTMEGVYSLLCNRYSMLQQRAWMVMRQRTVALKPCGTS